MSGDWSTLPMDLLGAIALRIETIGDFIYFSVVCRWWSDVSSKIKHQWTSVQVPWLLLAENEVENPNCFRQIYDVSQNHCYNFKHPETFGKKCWGTPHGWIVMFGKDLNVELFNPITKTRIPFPSSETITNGLPWKFDKDDEEDSYWYMANFFEKVIVVKVSHGDHHEFLIVVLTQFSVAFARHEDQSWTVLLSDDQCKEMVDIVDVDDKVFALFHNGTIVYWDVKELHMGEATKPIDFASGGNEVRRVLDRLRPDLVTKYLVHFDGDFLMVLRHKDTVMNSDRTVTISLKTYGFDVYKLNPKEKVWDKIEKLGGVALFIGGNPSMAISEALVNRGGIYFTEDEYQFLGAEFGGNDMGIYDMKLKTISLFYEGDDIRSTYSPPIWFIPRP